MFSIGIRYLCGRVLATHPSDRNRAEWPPHPDRVFMALTAAHFGTGAAVSEREALLWLETQPPPGLAASDCGQRSVVTHFVPVNDSAMPRIKSVATASEAQIEAGLELLPEYRPKQPRQFPAAVPDDETVRLIWTIDLPAVHRQALAELCRKVSYLGHSASLVQMWVEELPAEPTLIPVNRGGVRFRFRVPGPGRLSELEARFQAGMRPAPSRWSGYDFPQSIEVASTVNSTVFDENLMILRRVEGRPLGLESTLLIARALRDTLMSNCPVQPPPEWLSGHTPDGKPTEQDHVAFLVLPHVGREYADGHILGLALAIPRRVTSEDQMRCWRGSLFDEVGLPKPIELRLGHLGVWRLELDDRADRPVSLQPETWTAGTPATPCDRWATVTPIALDRHTKGDDKWKAIEETLARGCLRIGLPKPSVIIPSAVSMFIGAPRASSFPPIVRKSDGGRIHHTHAIITFPEPVSGPVLLGAGRYRGYGLCRPYRPENNLP